MSNEIILNADLRVRTGTNKTREIRREDSMVPAIIYGNDEESKNIKLKLNELTKASENELFYTQVLKILLEGNEEKVVLSLMILLIQQEHYLMRLRLLKMQERPK